MVSYQHQSTSTTRMFIPTTVIKRLPSMTPTWEMWKGLKRMELIGKLLVNQWLTHAWLMKERYIMAYGGDKHCKNHWFRSLAPTRRTFFWVVFMGEPNLPQGITALTKHRGTVAHAGICGKASACCRSITASELSLEAWRLKTGMRRYRKVRNICISFLDSNMR